MPDNATSVRPEWLRSFVTVADSPSYEAAAERLNTAQPTVWKQVSNLSRELGIDLFQKGTVTPTASGSQLLSTARRLLELHEDFRAQAIDLREGVTGVVRVACYPAHVKHFLAEATGLYKQKYPKARLVLSQFDQGGTGGKQLLDQLRDGEVDLAVGPRIQSFLGMHIYTSRIVVVLPENHEKRYAPILTVDDLKDESLLLSPRGYFSRTEIDRCFQAVGIEPHIETESSSWMALLALGEHGVGIPIVPDDTLDASSLTTAYPALVDDGGNEIAKETWLQWRRGEDMMPAVGNFVQFVRQYVSSRRNEK